MPLILFHIASFGLLKFAHLQKCEQLSLVALSFGSVSKTSKLSSIRATAGFPLLLHHTGITHCVCT